jgi:hypothetical protein
MINISKKRLWPSNEYELYRLNKRDRGRFLNVWFPEELRYDPLTIKGEEKQKVLTKDVYWTLKKVDKETANHLYNRLYNPIFISIGCNFIGSHKNRRVMYQMKAHIMSIDDSSYGIWWGENTIEYFREQRLKLMAYVDSLKLINKGFYSYDEINGPLFLEKCIELGANKESIDYN